MMVVMITVMMVAIRRRVRSEFCKETIEGSRVRVELGITRRVDEDAIVVDIVGVGQEGCHRCENN